MLHYHAKTSHNGDSNCYAQTEHMVNIVLKSNVGKLIDGFVATYVEGRLSKIVTVMMMIRIVFN